MHFFLLLGNFLFIPSLLLRFCSRWEKVNFDTCRVIRELCTKEFWLFSVLASLVTTWCIWVPAVSFIYAMPSSLQVPLFNLVLCFFVLCVAIILRPSSSPQEQQNDNAVVTPLTEPATTADSSSASSSSTTTAAPSRTVLSSSSSSGTAETQALAAAHQNGRSSAIYNEGPNAVVVPVGSAAVEMEQLPTKAPPVH